jgi:serine O-acetyltransferase
MDVIILDRMILTKIDYYKYLETDRIALGRNRRTLYSRIIDFFYPDYIWKFQRVLRKAEYYRNTRRGNLFKTIYYLIIKLRFIRLSLRLGFSIPENVFGPGLAIVHYGTIVVNAGAKIGKNCRINACVNIGESGGKSGAPVIGDNVYIAPGVKIYGRIRIAGNTAIAANACVSSTFEQENTLIGGIPAKILKKIDISSLIKHI